ncbi:MULTISPECIES: S4 domain-containing protein YaaA [Loigolactobacillus]|uniref:RNA-binding protein n=1 Tax=Loigolactobacillus backii TaxID=375175 RepID=A0A192H0Q6_9LACO|nr:MULTISPECIES: S4 domain-containing protein YaaA [Loigolactobacillus]ANK61827.1 RNA-binding protein [Loigolactobacillus backii]ANK68979.1 RNA-binding protein [Loigolactobacillus backii]MDA5388006.1 S4 domain-containing protein YaaA [Loigolactobacillus backii]MDA5390480.1 S4 domain-containing protein YaaA [Loigolactobacillus backii]PIO82345.1 RNA-binding protein [Loigolactobacillus backii]
MKKIVDLDTAYMTLGQLLKELGLIDSGGQAKWFLQEQPVLVNQTAENRRGRKLVADDQVTIPDVGDFILRQVTNSDDN